MDVRKLPLPQAKISSGTFTSRAVGVFYELCYCSSPGDQPWMSAEEFSVKAGSLIIHGPTIKIQNPYKHGDGKSGTVCSLTIDRQNLADGDRMVVIDYEERAVEADGGGNGITDLTDNGREFTRDGGDPITAVGGLHSLFWCGLFDPIDPNEDGRYMEAKQYQTKIGHLKLKGPFAHLARFCVNGRECPIDGCLGYELQSEDRLMFSGTCGFGRSSAIPGFTTAPPGMGKAIANVDKQ